MLRTDGPPSTTIAAVFVRVAGTGTLAGTPAPPARPYGPCLELGSGASVSNGMRLDDLAIGLDTAPMEAKSADRLPGDGGWQFEPKWDGFRCLAFRAGGTVALMAKSGKPLTRFFPEVVERLRSLERDPFVVDGELMIKVAGAYAFDALQMRLHPAESRIRKLAAETPADLVLFDCLLSDNGDSLLAAPLTRRHAALKAFHAAAGRAEGLDLTPFTRDRGSPRTGSITSAPPWMAWSASGWAAPMRRASGRC